MKYNNIIEKSIGVVFTTGLFGNYLINRKNTISKEDDLLKGIKVGYSCLIRRGS